MRKRPLRTREQARADIERRGISLAEWAREHGVNPKRVSTSFPAAISASLGNPTASPSCWDCGRGT